jgi:hypothetical protein
MLEVQADQAEVVVQVHLVAWVAEVAPVSPVAEAEPLADWAVLKGITLHLRL